MAVLVAVIGLLLAAEVFEPLVVLMGLLLCAEVFELLAVLVGLLVWAEQRPARPSDNAAIVNIFVVIILIFFLVDVALPLRLGASPLTAQHDQPEANTRAEFVHGNGTARIRVTETASRSI